MSERMFTGYPKIDPRMPHMAPVFGAGPIPQAPQSRDLAGDPFAPDDPEQDVSNPLSEIALGHLTASVSGGIVGGLASGDWKGAVIGAGVNSGMWGAYSLLGAWRTLAPRSRVILGASTFAGLGFATLLVMTRESRNGP